ncbi:hypothetical protein FB565_007321 [Actinoplanes lutulentus]|uniref:Uncharacterized protein n=1 Tax=Actinoplanes lutulentus TaxID=1287878 RepID=A0A327Z115_9ACTN|nr:hypothetical protein [Actinoplanes lutulentus]MBB2947550.1 hypothetical protein [Actinoplanes lutulentus]RAK25706.1 hypothetical protein B0I29_13157 [Actinoplanes lutulentus]
MLKPWIAYILIPLPVHVALTLMARSAQFADSPLQHFWVRVAIAATITAITTTVFSRHTAEPSNG